MSCSYSCCSLGTEYSNFGGDSYILKYTGYLTDTFTLSVLAGVAGAASDVAYPLAFLLRTNVLSAVLSLLAAALGAWLGARWYQRRAARR